MSVLSAAFYDVMANDVTLTGLISTYNGNPAIFTIDPAPGDVSTSTNMKFIVTAGEVTQTPFDTKNSLGRNAIRDIRCYAPANGSAIEVEAIAERVRTLFHRQIIAIAGFNNIITNVTGPLAADEVDAYGRILSVEITAMEA
jgi:hypothetical protein